MEETKDSACPGTDLKLLTQCGLSEKGLVYAPEEAVREAARCIGCGTRSCEKNCPAQNHIPEFISEVYRGNFERAWEILAPTNPLMELLGRVCPSESLCQRDCDRGAGGGPVEIRKLERFVADWHRAHVPDRETCVEPNGKSVAVVGSGPAGLTCALSLCECGFRIVIYEKEAYPGGKAVRGAIPSELITRLVKKLESRGCEMRYQMELGKNLSLDRIRNAHQSVVLATGCSDSAAAGVACDESGRIIVDHHYMTSLVNVYACGDAVTGRKTMVEAMEAGKEVATEIFSRERDW